MRFHSYPWKDADVTFRFHLAYIYRIFTAAPFFIRLVKFGKQTNQSTMLSFFEKITLEILLGSNDERFSFLIAEIGVNHNCDMQLAKRMIDAAKSSGADAVKFQTFTAETLVSPGTSKGPLSREHNKSSRNALRDDPKVGA